MKHTIVSIRKHNLELFLNRNDDLIENRWKYNKLIEGNAIKSKKVLGMGAFFC